MSNKLADYRNDTNALLNKLFNSPNPNDWGSKGYLIDRIAREIGITKVTARKLHKEWADQIDLDEEFILFNNPDEFMLFVKEAGFETEARFEQATGSSYDELKGQSFELINNRIFVS